MPEVKAKKVKRYHVDPRKMIPKRPLNIKAKLKKIPWDIIGGVLLLGAFITGGYNCYNWADAESYLILQYNKSGKLVDCVIAPEEKTEGCNNKRGGSIDDPKYYYGKQGKRICLDSKNIEVIEIGGCDSATEIMEERNISREQCLILIDLEEE